MSRSVSTRFPNQHGELLAASLNSPDGDIQAYALLAHHPKNHISLDQANHLLSQASDAYDVGQLIAAWVMRYLKC